MDAYYVCSPMPEWPCTQNTFQLPRWYMHLMSESLVFITASSIVLYLFHHLWLEVSLQVNFLPQTPAARMISTHAFMYMKHYISAFF